MKENVARARVRENRQRRRKGEGQADAQSASRLLEAQGSERVKLTTVSSGSQKCLREADPTHDPPMRTCHLSRASGQLRGSKQPRPATEKSRPVSAHKYGLSLPLPVGRDEVKRPNSNKVERDHLVLQKTHASQ